MPPRGPDQAGDLRPSPSDGRLRMSQPPAPGDDPHVHVVATGGTVANVTGEYDTPDAFLPGEELIERAPDLDDLATVTATDVARAGSSALTPRTWFDIASEITERAEGRDPPDGFVVTHGSNTAEETAYFLNLALETELPVVVTAAMRGHSEIGSEAFKNLYDAVRVAATPEASGRGTLLVANDEIHHAREVTKEATSRPDTWASPDAGPVGLASPGQPVSFYRSVDRRTATGTVFDVTDLSPGSFPLRDVYVVYATLGSDDTLVEAALDDDAAGLVVAGFPTGHGAKPDGMSAQSEALQRAASREIPVVISTRGSRGHVGPEQVHGYATAYGIGGDTLNPQKARILLALGLTETDDPGRLQEFFTAY
jgi:L-asparaginase